MSSACRVCLKSISDGDAYHARCLRALFGTSRVPAIDINLAKLHTAALAMVGHTSLSGIQKKISVGLSADRETLQVAADGGRYILKPQTGTFPHLPEIEHITMNLASLVEIDVPPCGLISLSDGSLAFISKRFDRTADGRKVRQEDFCQLAEQSPKDKYEGSAELCARLLRKYATEPLIELTKLFRQLLFAWWCGNGDTHLKNLSVLVDGQGFVRLTPAYDLLSTSLVIPDDPLALPVGGKKSKLGCETWLEFAGYCGIAERAASRIIRRQCDVATDAVTLIGDSFLPQSMKDEFCGFVLVRTRVLQSGRLI